MSSSPSHSVHMWMWTGKTVRATQLSWWLHNQVKQPECLTCKNKKRCWKCLLGILPFLREVGLLFYYQTPTHWISNQINIFFLNICLILVHSGHIMITNFLLNYFAGVDMELRNCHGFTAIMKAAVQGRASCVRALMMSGIVPQDTHLVTVCQCMSLIFSLVQMPQNAPKTNFKNDTGFLGVTQHKQSDNKKIAGTCLHFYLYNNNVCCSLCCKVIHQTLNITLRHKLKNLQPFRFNQVLRV